jgi:predicted amidophosphoribosyltransferase
LEKPIVPLTRKVKTGHAQKNLPDDVDPVENQAGTMSAIVPAGGLILVIDDLMRHASTIEEAARALVDGGASSVASLSLVKERTGTRRYQFP